MSSPVEAVRVGIGVVAEAGRVLVLPRTGDPGLGNVWEFPGGKVGLGEAPSRAALREVLEETGLTARVVDRVCSVCHTYPDRRVELHAFLCAIVPDEARSCRSGRWVTLAECATLPMPAANAAVLSALGSYDLEPSPLDKR